LEWKIKELITSKNIREGSSYGIMHDATLQLLRTKKSKEDKQNKKGKPGSIIEVSVHACINVFREYIGNVLV
jgi:hypothetical protein